MIAGPLDQGCAGCGATIAPSDGVCRSCGAAAFEPNRRIVAVLFADLSGYTAFAADRDPEDVARLVRPVMDRLRVICERAGGIVPGVAGDGFMSVSGARVAREDDLVRLCAAAADMQRLMAENSPGLPPLRVGIHAGEVLVSPSWEHGGVAVTGDVVNVGSRLCGEAPPGTVLVSAEAAHLLAGRVPLGELVSLQLRGRPHPVAARELRWRDLDGVLSTARLLSQLPLVDRDAERAELDRASAERRPVLLVGEAGVGKSRLVSEWSVRKGATLLLSSCPGFGGDDLAGLRGLAAGAIDTGSPLSPAVSAMSPVQQRRLRRLAGRPTDTHESDTAEEQATALLELLDTVVDEHPLVVVVEDVHWASEVVLQTLGRLGDVASRAALVGATTRLDGAPELPGFARIELGPLNSADALTLARAALPDATAPLLRRLAEQSGGLPLFVEQCAELLRDQRSTDSDDELPPADGPRGHGRDVPTPRTTPGDPSAGSTLPLPNSMRLLLTARLDQLPAAARRLVGAAAVLGAEVHPEPLRSIAADALDQVEVLVERGILHRDPGQGGLRFVHALVRDAAYADQTRARREQLHASVGRWYATQTGRQLDDGLAAAHLLAAWQLDPESEVLAREAHDAHVRLVEKLAEEQPRRAQVLLEEAERIDRVVPQGVGAAVARRVAQIALAIASGTEEQILPLAYEALHWAQEAELRPEEARVNEWVGRLLAGYQSPDVARGHFARAAELYRALGRSDGEARVTVADAMALEWRQGAAAVTVALRRAYRLAEEAGDEALAARCAQLLAARGHALDRSEAERWLTLAERKLRPEDHVGRAWLQLSRGALARHELRPALAVTLLRDAVADGRAAMAYEPESNARIGLLRALIDVGRLDEARREYLDLLAIAEGRPTPVLRMITLAEGALLEQRSGRLADARAARDEAARIAPEYGRWLVRDIDEQDARLALEAGRYAEVLPLADRVTAADAELGHTMPTLPVRGWRLAALAAAGTPVADVQAEAAAVRTQAERLGVDRAAALAMRWAEQAVLLVGGQPTAAAPLAGIELAEARALEQENAALRDRDASRFLAAAEAWAELGVTAWRARALIWRDAAVGDPEALAEARRLLVLLEAPDDLPHVWAAQLPGGHWR